MGSSSHARSRARLAGLQGGYFLATGVWPILHLRSFEAITGPKPEGWLVKTVGALVGVVGAVLLDAAARRDVGRTASALAIGSATALAAVDIVYAGKRRIAPVYLLDAVLELALVGAWTRALRRS